MAHVNSNDFTLLLYHKPDLAYAAQELGINLYLSGHTHGGQVCLPFIGALFTNSRYEKTFKMGLYHLGITTLLSAEDWGLLAGMPHEFDFWHHLRWS
jgi:uncharacterized protein